MTPKVRRKIRKIHQSPVCGLSPQVYTLYAYLALYNQLFQFSCKFFRIGSYGLGGFFPLHAFWILALICLFFFSFLEEGKHKGAVPKYHPDWKQEIVFSLVP
jgi:hypothetical protein